jgi:hypothetical protein
MNNHSIFILHIQPSLRFAILPIVIVLLGKYLFEALILDFPLLNEYIKSQLFINNRALSTTILLHEFKARLLWLTSVLLYFFVNICFFYFLWNILKKVTRKDRLTFIVIALFFSVIEIIYLCSTETISSPLNNIFRFPFSSLAAANLFSPTKLSLIFYILGIINFVAILAVFFSIIAGCCIIRLPSTDIIQLNKQFIILKDLVRGASAIMIAGIIHMQLWLSWPLSLTPNFANLTELKNVISTIILFWGVCFSLTIAALYLPIATHFRNKAISFYESDTPTINTKNKQDWRQDNPLFKSPSAQISQIVTILGPMLVGTIGPALSTAFSV